MFCKIELPQAGDHRKYEKGLVHSSCYDWLRAQAEKIPSHGQYIGLQTFGIILDRCGIPRDVIYQKGQQERIGKRL
jgi:hypothetical protein